ncbi:hypothetical protein ACLOAU_21590 [Niabella sp. CJ426]|uniref:hypothetical protein n=1 Tax=Niabella sp. CJ426 TaxID=3393740 RepID=UPI003CFC1B60
MLRRKRGQQLYTVTNNDTTHTIKIALPAGIPAKLPGPGNRYRTSGTKSPVPWLLNPYTGNPSLPPKKREKIRIPPPLFYMRKKIRG